MVKKGFSRRDFLRLAVLSPLVLNSFPSKGQPLSSGSRSRVVLIRHEKVVDEKRRVNSEIFQAMLDEALTVLFETKSHQEAWKKIIRSDDIVGIKSNVWSYLPTGREIEEAIKRRIMDCGIPESKIGIDDRGVLRNKIFLQATALINVRPARTHYWSGMGGCIKNLITFVPNPSIYHQTPVLTWPSSGIIPSLKVK